MQQFIDLGCGLPTLLDVHSIARSVVPGARVVYVDNDPLVAVHSLATSARLPGIVAIEGGTRYPEKILADPQLALIDFSEPVMVLLAAVLHSVDLSENAAAIVAAFTGRMVPGSPLAISHAVTDGSDPRIWRRSPLRTSALAPHSPPGPPPISRRCSPDSSWPRPAWPPPPARD